MRTLIERALRLILTATILISMHAAVSAQTVPEIVDVYATPDGEKRDLGPTRDPLVILDRVTAATKQTGALRYDVEIVDSLAPEGLRLFGSVLLDFGSLDSRRSDPSRYRASIRGRGPDGQEVAAVFAYDGRQRSALDLLQRRTTKGEAEPEWLRDYVLLPLEGVSALEPPDNPGPVYLGPADVGGEPCYLVHYPSGEAQAHVYGYFSQNDAWPRRIEHVFGTPSNQPAIVEASFANLVPDPPVNDGQFEPFLPTGFAESNDSKASR